MDKIKIPKVFTIQAQSFVKTIVLTVILTMISTFTLYYTTVISPMRDKLYASTIENKSLQTQVDTLTEKATDLARENENLKNPEYIEVTITNYHPVPEQCDDTPDELADGTKIDIWKASDYNYIAISWDMHKRLDKRVGDKNSGFLDFGDYVHVTGYNDRTKKMIDGIYQVRDVMNPRWKNRIDILTTPGEDSYVFWDASISKIHIPELEVVNG